MHLFLSFIFHNLSRSHSFLNIFFYSLSYILYSLNSFLLHRSSIFLCLSYILRSFFTIFLRLLRLLFLLSSLRFHALLRPLIPASFTITEPFPIFLLLTDMSLGMEEWATNSSASAAAQEAKYFNKRREEECAELHAQMPPPDPSMGEYTRQGYL